ncbi:MULTISPECIES: PKD domain-containing protein [unclassified Streptomyces]|uniref:PKD domain-containing protein n=1 Tax=unclassified Streptomyces TaxID=2593676 RepID=UPI0022B66829|nr:MULTISPECIES: PKD domain-containing protein [unclassified Streptomyces]MCZ7416527.1 PKD domain-containing protein [Streptomyces sp. WMMC897]MCZ7433662.1 PKD domain-containing protein [Streptomyces sp. WMMC1477]
MGAAEQGVVGNPGSGSPNLLLNVTGLGDAPEPGQPSAECAADCSQTEPACAFDASGSTDADGDVASYAWSFGDGGTGGGVTVSHAYPVAQQNYTAQLTVTDAAGNSDTATRQIQCWGFGTSAFCFGQ